MTDVQRLMSWRLAVLDADSIAHFLGNTKEIDSLSDGEQGSNNEDSGEGAFEQGPRAFFDQGAFEAVVHTGVGSFSLRFLHGLQPGFDHIHRSDNPAAKTAGPKACY